MNLPETIHENLQKHHRVDLMENGEIEVTQAERDELEDWWIENGDDLYEALDTAGILVSAGMGWFPHPEWLYRLPQLGLFEEDTDAIIDYVHDYWPESLMLLGDIEATGIERAITAYAKRCKQKHLKYNQPSTDLSTVEVGDFIAMGCRFHRLVVVLRNENGELARYEPFCKWKDYEYAGFGLRYVEAPVEAEAA
jgi:hypothetical protein